ncbi:MAG: hypothetical protein K5931_06165 [Lachnospiraceae bacterium]|nr:hypothetical protein [Lachnospiraceae bacterium]
MANYSNNRGNDRSNNQRSKRDKNRGGGSNNSRRRNAESNTVDYYRRNPNTRNSNSRSQGNYTGASNRQNRAPRPANNKVVRYRAPINLNPGIIIFGLLFIYIVVIVSSYFRSEPVTPYEVQLGSLAVNNTYTGIVLREEAEVATDYSGYINYYAREGEKVAKNSMVYTVDSSGEISEMLNDTGRDDEINLSNEDMSNLKSQISGFSSSFSPENFLDTYNFKFDIEGTVLKLANYKVLSSIDALSASSLADSVDFGYSTDSGVIVYSHDGYESVRPEQVTTDMLDKSKYEKVQYHSNELVADGDTVYKLITSEDWSIVIQIDEEKCKELEAKNVIEVRFLRNNYTSWAYITILRQNGQIFARLDFNNSMITFASDRYLDIELLSNSEEGLKIPNSAIVEKAFFLIPIRYSTNGGGNSDDVGFLRETYLEDGSLSSEYVKTTIYNRTEEEYYVDENDFKIGDYVVDPGGGEKYPISKQGTLIGVYNINKGYADFKQITILYQNDEYAIVKSNTEYGLSVYDHIVLDGSTVNENDLIYEMKK